MSKKLEKVAILGAGIMGSQIAAHFANAGIPSLLFDVNQQAALSGLQAARKIKPAAFYSPRYSRHITPCNYDEHLEMLKDADWIIEVIIEKIELKQQLFQRILPFLKPGAIISSNTSGLSLAEMSEGLPREFRQHFLITHFFNPPRYMHLLEIVAGADTDPEIVKTVVAFAENILGKGIVYAKDTPNFVANRIGVYGMMLALQLTEKLNLKVNEVDQLTGPLIGRAKSATYRTADLVGLDTLAHVANTAYQKCPDDESRALFKVPAILEKLIEAGRLGSKSKAGFYRKAGREILQLDFSTLEYLPQKKVKMDSIRVAKRRWELSRKLKTMAFGEDKAAQFTWELLAGTLLYAAHRVPEIADDIVNIDNAMKWGFGWQLGPFETWEALGFADTYQRMSEEGRKIPQWIQQMYRKGIFSFYQKSPRALSYLDIGSTEFKKVQENPRNIRPALFKTDENILRRNWNADLLDIGKQVALLEFHSILQPNFNPLDGAVIDMISEAIRVLPERGYKALVIGHQGMHFSAGANLALILKYSQEQNWQMLEKLSSRFQQVMQEIRFSPIPVVAAPFQLCLGGGYEIIGACARRVASAELYCGLVEVGVGVIPGAGGNLRLLLNNFEAMSKGRPGLFPIVQKAFETIGFAKVSASAKEAVALGYLTRQDKIIMNPDQLIWAAREEGLEMAKDYQPPEYRKDIYLPGEGGRLAIESTLENFVKAGTISAHDFKIGKKLASVLTGGEIGNPFRPVDEQYILDIEREAFVSLCGEPLSQARMQHMLKTGKALRN